MKVRLTKDGGVKILSKESKLIKILLAEGWKEEKPAKSKKKKED
jgi:hypothetical protein